MKLGLIGIGFLLVVTSRSAMASKDCKPLAVIDRPGATDSALVSQRRCVQLTLVAAVERGPDWTEITSPVGWRWGLVRRVEARGELIPPVLRTVDAGSRDWANPRLVVGRQDWHLDWRFGTWVAMAGPVTC